MVSSFYSLVLIQLSDLFLQQGSKIPAAPIRPGVPRVGCFAAFLCHHTRVSTKAKKWEFDPPPGHSTFILTKNTTMAKGTKPGAKRGPYKKKRAGEKKRLITNTGRREVNRILKSYRFDPDSKKGGKVQLYDVVIHLDNPADESKHADLSMTFSAFFKKNEKDYSTVAFGYDAEKAAHGGRGVADVVAIFDSEAHAAQNTPIAKSGRLVNSRRHISTIMRVLRIKLPERGQKKEAFLTLEHIHDNVYRLSELKGYTREVQPMQTGE